MQSTQAGRRFHLGLALLLVLPLLGGGALPSQAPGGPISFPQTGKTLTDAHGFLSYWQAHGGLAQFGYPLTDETPEVSPTDGRVYITQWFERNRFEYHPEYANSPFAVL